MILPPELVTAAKWIDSKLTVDKLERNELYEMLGNASQGERVPCYECGGRKGLGIFICGRCLGKGWITP